MIELWEHWELTLASLHTSLSLIFTGCDVCFLYLEKADVTSHLWLNACKTNCRTFPSAPAVLCPLNTYTVRVIGPLETTVSPLTVDKGLGTLWRGCRGASHGSHRNRQTLTLTCTPAALFRIHQLIVLLSLQQQSGTMPTLLLTTFHLVFHLFSNLDTPSREAATLLSAKRQTSTANCTLKSSSWLCVHTQLKYTSVHLEGHVGEMNRTILSWKRQRNQSFQTQTTL